MIDVVMPKTVAVEAIVGFPAIRNNDCARFDPSFDNLEQDFSASILHWYHEYAASSSLDSTKNLKKKMSKSRKTKNFM